MLQKLSDQIRTCHERAAEAKVKAEATSDATLKADYLGVADRWLALARSYEVTDRIADFTAANAARRQKHGELAKADEQPDVLLLHEISTSLIREGDVHGLYERIVDGAISLMSADMGSMQLLDPAKNELRLLAWRGFHPASAAFWDRINLDTAYSSCGAASASGRRVVVPDTEACDFMTGTADLASYTLSNIRAVQSTPLVSRSGELLGMISTHWREPHQPAERTLRLFDLLARQAADLIERTQREQQLRLLARETEHRAKNVLATVQATVHLTHADTVDDFKKTLAGRIQTLANVQRLFVETRWAGAGIRQLANEELAAYSQRGDAHVQISGPECLLDPVTAQAISVILHELATNAAKYGALSVPNGNVQVEWWCESGRPLVLRWTETDGPPVGSVTRRGVGTRIIEDMTRDQLRGEAKIDYRPEGLCCEIKLPALESPKSNE
jgi:two-component sensor histidine kinase